MQAFYFLQRTALRHLSRQQTSPVISFIKTGYQSSYKNSASVTLTRPFNSCNRPGLDKFKWPSRTLRYLKQHSGASLFFKSSEPFQNGLVIVAVRRKSGDSKETSDKSVVYYLVGVIFLMLGFGVISVPLFKLFCQQVGLGGQPTRGHDASKLAELEPVEDREITVKFVATVNKALKWKFVPQQTSVQVKPGETALAFFTAKNLTDRPVTGISTYNVLPYQAAVHFNKVQCFCFEEQRLNPQEEVDMPVFFYIDPEYAEDHYVEKVNEIILSYTFYESDGSVKLPLPGYVESVDTKGNKLPMPAVA
ncbi:cytochrome c oxidase assembly protein COX11, mitochondrial isoform X2 [Lingula anatina]|uniref:Cytochrome c oxidase assembly protein COX11, mitochondrial n=1 Tax=Lingula anatina TaxID=7574 RepID=A0A1S3KD75_LINAN|nr:cytochrome c oxidase assembly protein COX11, mitochondrial isoform X1 [Lingula anatina]XP_013420451.1 cytochrome c oxidase assembly protein COX11, mitochondrial isoform X2 [Lingula anatina]XP_013420452.1 cytochrome c oxidase assembly protein COX11, mitochondrial isoform X2 [Lingula anatina]XP_013420455.1 cytochrome c oxidase assembly protein COX11, mitochondrial isoform X2 [Lingula anatina]|eukprot:XP_013420450.1 cytochrome c oxidase assembly protein COX11, mitochondrial isoform X1 [Lingula anatina]